MDDLARIRGFIRWYEDAVAERRTPWRYGTVLHDDTFANKYDANFLRVERPVGDATAADLTAIADAIQDGHRHREFVFPDDREGERLAGAFVEAGYEAARLVEMSLRRDPDRPAPRLRAGEVAHATVRPAMVRSSLEETPTMSREDAEMLADYRTVPRDTIGGRFFAAWDEDVLAGMCDLYLHDGVGQIESVETLAAHRNRGVARAVLGAAIGAAREAGADLVFLVADDADWPKVLYGKLGFDPVGYHRQFTKMPPPS